MNSKANVLRFDNLFDSVIAALRRDFLSPGYMIISVVLLFSSLLFRVEGFTAQAQIALSASVSRYLQKRFEEGVMEKEGIVLPPKIIVGKEFINASLSLLRFYDYRQYQPVWSDDAGPLSRCVYSLVNVICQADHHGLQFKDYHLSAIFTILARIYRNLELKGATPPETLADLDLLLTDAFYMYNSHLRFGRVNPEKIGEGWFIDRWKADLTETLQNAINSNQIGETLNSMMPSQPDYHRLQQALAIYRTIAKKGGWPEIPSFPKIMKRGMKGKYVSLLRKRLMIEGDFNQPINNDGDLFDDTLEQALQRFQDRHGLVADGIVGPLTRGALNISVYERMRQIELNMERIRWLPDDLGERYILVNIADFSLMIVENEQSILSMRIVAGKPYTTKIFSAQLTYLVLNPYWNIPQSITMEEILPRIQQDPGYLAKKSIKIFQGWDDDEKEIDPATITWDTNSDNFRYRLRQGPGPQNPVGRIKFMFPNRYNIYLHDTPHRHHFAKAVRNFSHGCIRVEKPIELAEYLLRADPFWTRKKILSMINQKEKNSVSLPKSIPIYIVYYTAWVNEDNIVQFRNDIDGRDEILDEALNDFPPPFIHSRM